MKPARRSASDHFGALRNQTGRKTRTSLNAAFESTFTDFSLRRSCRVDHPFYVRNLRSRKLA
jgi:hypothetical protein